MTTTTVSSNLPPSFNIHNVGHIVVKDSELVNGSDGPFYTQRITFLDKNGTELADLSIFTDSPVVALDVSPLEEMEDSST